MELGPFIMFLNSHSKHTGSGISGEFRPFQGELRGTASPGARLRGDGELLGRQEGKHRVLHCARRSSVGRLMSGVT